MIMKSFIGVCTTAGSVGEGFFMNPFSKKASKCQLKYVIKQYLIKFSCLLLIVLFTFINLVIRTIQIESLGTLVLHLDPITR